MSAAAPPHPRSKEGGPGNTSGFVPQRSRRWRGASLSACPQGCEQSWLSGRGDPWTQGRGRSGGRPRTGARCPAASPGARFLTSLRKLEPSGANATPEPLRLRLGWSFQNLGEKPVLHSLRHTLPELESILDKRLCQRGWAPVPFLASPLIPSFSIPAVRGLQPAPNAWGCGEEGNPSPGTLVSSGRASVLGSPSPSGRTALPEPTPW